MKLRALPVIALVAALATPVWAQVSRDDAAAAAQRASGGRVLSVDKSNDGTWRVKVVTPRGEVRVIVVDASGRAG